MSTTVRSAAAVDKSKAVTINIANSATVLKLYRRVCLFVFRFWDFPVYFLSFRHQKKKIMADVEEKVEDPSCEHPDVVTKVCSILPRPTAPRPRPPPAHATPQTLICNSWRGFIPRRDLAVDGRSV